MRFLIAFLISVLSLFGALQDKSAIVYYGEDISYPMVGIHDYIIVQPNHVNPYTQGFKIYKDKIYAYVSIGELDRTLPEYKLIKKEWKAAKNKMWNSDALDIRNKDYQEFLFTHMIDPLIKKGYENFFFDTLDSYHLYTKTPQEKQEAQNALAGFINEFHKRYPKSKLIINRGFHIIDKVKDAITAVLFESYYSGIGDGKNPYKEVTNQDRVWLDQYLNKIKSYHKDIISVEYLPTKDIFSQKAQNIIQKIKEQGMIPYIANKDLRVYGNSSKTAIKREIFTLIDESAVDRSVQDAQILGEMILEYFGYKEKLYDISKGLPSIDQMMHYKAVMIWLQYTKYSNNTKLFQWIHQLIKHNIKVLFMGNFALDNVSNEDLAILGITMRETDARKVAVSYKDSIVGYEIDPPLGSGGVLFNISDKNVLKNSKPILTYKYSDGSTSTPIAITPWGGYMVIDGYLVTLDEQNLWVVNPFSFFKKALRLEDMPIPDVTTKTGKRILFTHVDGDGLSSGVEGNFGKYAGDSLYKHVFTKYNIPHSVSIIGSEVDPNGLNPKISKELIDIVKQIYKLPNVEGATHTYTHPFFWDKITKDGNLSPQYRLDVKGYKFSLKRELYDTVENINNLYYPKDKTPKVNTVFWSGDCAPRVNALSFIAKHNIQAINGGDTTITYEHPWLSLVSSLGIERKNFVQIYTGAQNENVFTNNWLGPFWGFKRVVQTFKLTGSPRRLKPIDIYYHIYSGSKRASLKAVQYVMDWAIKQDTHPIFTSEYIPRVEEFFNYSVAKDTQGNFLYAGLKALDTLRIEQKDVGVDFNKSKQIIGIKHFENHTYLTLDTTKKPLVHIDTTSMYKKDGYLVSANGAIKEYKKINKKQYYHLKGYMPLKITLHIPSGCNEQITPKPSKIIHKNDQYDILYKSAKEAQLWIECSK